MCQYLLAGGTKNPEAGSTESKLEVLLGSPLFLAEFKEGIRDAKTNSAPGMSGLPYNMLKSLPDKTEEYYYAGFVQFWLSDCIVAPWKWRWLHIIPKTQADNLSPGDLRPLMLCEVLRKLMSTNILHKVLDVFFVTRVVDPSHHAYLAGRGTESATMLVINYREDAEEKHLISEQSSFDEEKAFDTTSKPFMEWSWRRLGVPREVARWLAHMNGDGITVAKTPFAQSVWALLPYRFDETQGKYPPHTHEVSPESALSTFQPSVAQDKEIHPASSPL